LNPEALEELQFICWADPSTTNLAWDAFSGKIKGCCTLNAREF
jgi:hypothetical protein